MKDLKDRLHNMRGNPMPYWAKELSEILGDLLDRLDTEPQMQTGKTVCCSCGKDVTSQFPPE